VCMCVADGRRAARTHSVTLALIRNWTHLGILSPYNTHPHTQHTPTHTHARPPLCAHTLFLFRSHTHKAGHGTFADSVCNRELLLEDTHTHTHTHTHASSSLSLMYKTGHGRFADSVCNGERLLEDTPPAPR